MSEASLELEAFIDETIKRSKAKGCHPTKFIGMRQSLGAVPAISRLVQNSEPQSGFWRLHELGLLEWTIEAAVEKFPAEFTPSDLAYAPFHLRRARQGEY